MDSSDMNLGPSLSVDKMSLVAQESEVPPVDKTLTRVVVLMRLLGWIWLIALVATTAQNPEASRSVLLGTVVLGTAGTGITLLAVRRGFLGDVWYAELESLIHKESK